MNGSMGGGSSAGALLGPESKDSLSGGSLRGATKRKCRRPSQAAAAPTAATPAKTIAVC
jgi:hypothetical protein